MSGNNHTEARMPTLQLYPTSTLYYELIEGSPDHPYLVFLHEGLGCVAMWRDYPRRLCASTGCPGLAYDRQGYGRSGPQRNPRTLHYLHEFAYDELPALLSRVIPDRQYILVGHSDGGTISLIYGATKPPLLTAIITEAAHVFVEPETVAGVKIMDEAWNAGKLRALSRFHGPKAAAVFTSWSSTWLSTWFKPWNIESLLPGIEKPLMVIQGINDQYGSTAQVDAIAAGTSGCVRTEYIDNCGHTPHFEAQPHVLGLMTEFVRSQLPD